MKELVRELGAVLDVRKRCEWLVCRYLADLSDRVELVPIVGLTGFSDVYDAASRLFGLSMRSTRERLRVGRKLRELPHIERAFIDNEISYAKVRTLTRAATPETEIEWLACARERGIRDLERLVTNRLGLEPRPVARPDAHSREDWVTPNGVEVTFAMSTEAWAIVRRALEVARDQTAGGTDGESLAEVARAALASTGGELQSTITLQKCPNCARTQLDTGAGAMDIDTAAAAAFIPSLSRQPAAPRQPIGGAHPSPLRTGASSSENPAGSLPSNPTASASNPAASASNPAASASNPAASASNPAASSPSGPAASASNPAASSPLDSDTPASDPTGSSPNPVIAPAGPTGSLPIPVGPSGNPAFRTQATATPNGFATLDRDFFATLDRDFFATLDRDHPSPRSGPGIRSATSSEPALRPNEQQVLAAMGGRGAWCMDELCARTGLEISEVSQAIGALLIEGLITSEACLYSPVRVPRRAPG